jgi:hypothetical protein
MTHNRNRDWKLLTIPERMQRLDKDVRVLPIPFLIV